jgi:hypothetical protein
MMRSAGSLVGKFGNSVEAIRTSGGNSARAALRKLMRRSNQRWGERLDAKRPFRARFPTSQAVIGDT